MLTGMSRGSRFLLILIIASMTIAARKRGRTGKLIINSLNMGAEVFVDGSLEGRIPLQRPLRLRTGKHTLRVSQLGHADFLDTIKIRRNRKTTVNISLVAVAGVLRVEGDPSGAEVFIDGRLQGLLPYRGVVDPGRHLLEVRALDHETHRANRQFEAGEEISLAVRLAYAPRPPPVAVEQWYTNEWLWAGTAGVVLTAAIVTAIALSGDDDPQSDRPVLFIETVR
jgi:hypothetical protein